MNELCLAVVSGKRAIYIRHGQYNKVVVVASTKNVFYNVHTTVLKMILVTSTSICGLMRPDTLSLLPDGDKHWSGGRWWWLG